MLAWGEPGGYWVCAGRVVVVLTALSSAGQSNEIEVGFYRGVGVRSRQ